MDEKHAYPFQCEGEDCPLCYLDEIIEQLHARIKELEDGSCRYNCRKRKESCQSFAYYFWKNWRSLMMPPSKALDDMYAEWKKDK